VVGADASVGLLAAADQERAAAVGEFGHLVDAAGGLLAEGLDPTRVCMALCMVLAGDLGVDPVVDGGAATAVAMVAAVAVRDAQQRDPDHPDPGRPGQGGVG
jgi:hypothetical protein